MSTTSEEWRDVPGWEGLYRVSSIGRVRGRIRKGSTGMPLTPTITKKGYANVNLKLIGRRQSVLVHRLVLCAWVGPPKPGQQTRHLNGNPSDNRVENLAWGTVQDNANDRMTHGTGAKGERFPHSRFTQDDIRTMRRLRKAGRKFQAIADRFGTSSGRVHEIVNRRAWKHVV